MKIDKITAIDSEKQLVHVTISHGSDKYKYDMNTPVLEGDALQAHCDSVEFKHLNNILYQVYDRNIQFSSEAEWDEWCLVGLLGQIPITKGQPVADNWIKMKDVSDTVEMYFVK